MKTQNIEVGGYAAFPGDDDHDVDVDGAVRALCNAGHRTVRMTEADRQRLHHPCLGDEFILVTTDVPAGSDYRLIDRLWVEVNVIVSTFGGWVDEYGILGDTSDPFAMLFDAPISKGQ